jgi:hypothetical protein
MLAGDVPNVDFLHLYGPGSLHVLMGWYELFGFTLASERTFGLLQHIGSSPGSMRSRARGATVSGSCAP